uniref:Uncharacterized protein n=1 Tax=Leersia perrieri TaxID=77586 RepID=A0A0D9W1T1_9ORYZ
MQHLVKAIVETLLVHLLVSETEMIDFPLDIGEGNEINFDNCPRSKLQSHFIKYLGPKKKGSFQHYGFWLVELSHLLEAGQFLSDKIDIVVLLYAIWPYNSHYLPTDENFGEFISYLLEDGINLADVKRSSINKDE